MRRNGLFFAVIVSTVITSIQADEPVRSQQPIKQRVNPKVLREALALQEYQTRTNEAAPPSLDELQRLHEKLKKNGDDSEADMVQRFIHEHRRLITQSVRRFPAVSGKLIIHAKVFEVNPADLPMELITHGKTVSDPSDIQTELDRLISTKRAKCFTSPQLLEGKTSIPVRCFTGGEFMCPVENEHLMAIELRELGAVLELTPSILTNETLRLQSTCEIFDGEPESRSPLRDTSNSDRFHKIQTVYDVKFGDAAIHSYASKKHGRGFVVIMEVTPRS